MITPTQYNLANPVKPVNPINANKKSAPKPNFGGISFGSRPEYDYFDNKYEVRTSNYFRRGQYYGSQKEEFKDVVSALKLVMSKNRKPKILIAGLGDAQEPFSLLAVIKKQSWKPLKSAVDLNCVDLQPKISDEALDGFSYLDANEEPLFAKKSFDYVEKAHPKSHSHYKVKPKIFEYLKSVFNDPEKTKWDTKIEEFAAAAPEKSYNMISINNVLLYIEDKEAAKTTMQNLSKMLKKNGILVTDIFDDFYKETFDCLKDFKKLNPGIWKKMI